MDAREDKYFARRHNVSCDDSCELLLFKEDEPDEPYVVPGRRFSEEVQAGASCLDPKTSKHSSGGLLQAPSTCGELHRQPEPV